MLISCVFAFCPINAQDPVSAPDTTQATFQQSDAQTRYQQLIKTATQFADNKPDQALNYAFSAYRQSVLLKSEPLQADALFAIAYAQLRLNRYSEALSYFQQTISIRKRLNQPEGLAVCFNRMGNTYQLQRNFTQATDCYKQALALNREIGNVIEIARTLTNIGSVSQFHGNYNEAFDAYFEALQIYRDAKNDQGMAWVYLNIGRLMRKKPDYPQALDYVTKSLAFYTQNNDVNGTTLCLKEAGEIYFGMGEYDRALENHQQLLKLNRESNNRFAESTTLSSIGKIYFKTGNLALSQAFLTQALELKKQLKDNIELASTLRYLGDIYLSYNQYDISKKYYEQSVEVARMQSSREDLMEVYRSMGELFKNRGDYKKAFQYTLLFNTYKDSLKTTELARRELQYGYEQKQKQLELEKLAQKNKLDRQRMVLWALLTGSFLMLLVLFLIYRNYKHKKRANELLKQQNEAILRQNLQIEEQKREIEIQRDTAQSQRDKITRQKQQITDSIEYALRIQQAMLPQNQYIEQLLDDYFILYQPRDIVSGDFYWVSQVDSKIIVVVGDCTGHGVPGAFMSMLGISLLNEIIIRRQVNNTAQILEMLRQHLMEALHQHSSDAKASRDGMDISLCLIDRETQTYTFSGAFHSMVHLGKNGLCELSGDKKPIGWYIRETQPFTAKQEAYQQGDMLYLYTDGYIDQFGGTDGQKFKRKRLYEQLQQIHILPTVDQKEILTSELINWKGDTRQIDDILIMGIRL